MVYDFGGWATRNNLRCSDGRTIRKNAFIDQDGKTVPLVWNHDHKDAQNVLGHALLENREEGVYAYGTFNDTEAGQNAKLLVEHGDIGSLSIYANQLKQTNSRDVVHGKICEVSLVLAGANPGACIVEKQVRHSDISDEDEIESAEIYNDVEEIYISHAEKDNKKKEDDDKESEEKPEEKEEEKKSDDAKSEDKKSETDSDEKKPETKETKPEEEKKEMAEVKKTEVEIEKKAPADSDKTVKDVFDTLNDEQKTVVYALIGQAIADAEEKNKSSKEEDEQMKHNVFESEEQYDDTLVHDGLNTIMKEGKRCGSLRDAFLEHAAEYGIENIDFIKPDDKSYTTTPKFINTHPNDWVGVIMNGVHNTPFANIKMLFADITEDEARAKGYIKGHYKKEEVFKLLKRSVSPTTIYKKQKFDKDDLADADFDVIPWIKEEMNIKFDEEKARAYIFGDGRSTADDDKVDETHIIPAAKDEDLFTIKKTVTPAQDESLEHAIVTASVLAQDDYQGSGNLIAFVEQKQASKLMLMEDKFGHRLYKTPAELAGAMGVSKIVKVPSSIIGAGTYAVMLDLSDYNVGIKNQGKKNFFDDFDIDYNQNKYLIEERQSGALTRPYSAIVLKANGNAG